MKTNELSNEEQEAIELEKFYYETVKPFYDKRKANIEALVKKFGVDHYFQDQETGLVFKIDVCQGSYVFNKPFELKRTRFEGETKGSLSIKEAEAQGFILTKQGE
ncbi:MAG: hypothetical protein WBP82_08690 [Leuconostoc mesenteroides]